MLTERELALIMTVLKLMGKPATPHLIQSTFKAMLDQIESPPADSPGEFIPGPSDIGKL